MATPNNDGDGSRGVDLISGLTDDLLVRILDLLPDTRDAVQTHALSRRWRGLWAGVSTLLFNSRSWPSAVSTEVSAGKQYLAFIDDTLAFRDKETRRRCYATKEPSVEDLKISLDMSRQKTGELLPRSFQAAQGWIRYAVHHEVKSLILKLCLPSLIEGHLVKNLSDHVMAVDELASYAKLETLHLSLGHAQLGLSLSSSSTVVFTSLADLSLGDITVEGHLLSHLVSPLCCPRLRKLQLVNLHLSMMEGLLVEADTLLELSIEMVDKMQSLELRTPSLQVLHVEECFDLEGFTVVSAPRLQDLIFDVLREHLDIVDIHDHLSSVQTLNIPFYSHGDYDGDDRNDGSIHLLQRCRSTRCLEVDLDVVEDGTYDIIKGRIPPLPHVTTSSIHLTLWEPHRFGSAGGIASFLAKCNNIRYLSLQLCYCIEEKDCSESDALCGSSCHWDSHEFSLAHLQEVEFKNLIGTNCEFRFIQSILTRDTGLIQKVAISFDPWRCRLKDNNDAFKLLPALEGGLWATSNDASLSYKWKRSCP